MSAGLLMCRPARAGASGEAPFEVLLAHPGGPFFARKDDGSWGVPKGLLEGEEDLLAAARREFVEETGFPVPTPASAYLSLDLVRTSRRKAVHVWAFAGDADPAYLVSNPFEIEWPPRSGRRRSFPEVDRVGWFDLATARVKIVAYQRPLLDRLVERWPPGDRQPSR